MLIEPLTKVDQIRPGDTLLISDGKMITPATALRVKVSEHDGTEVIFDLKRNKFFNVGMYLEGESWAKDIRIVRMTPSACSHVAKHTGMYEPFDTTCKKCGSFLTPNPHSTTRDMPQCELTINTIGENK